MLLIKGKVNQKLFLVGQVVTFALLLDRHLIMTTMGGGTFYDTLGSFAFSNPSTKLTFFIGYVFLVAAKNKMNL